MVTEPGFASGQQASQLFRSNKDGFCNDDMA